MTQFNRSLDSQQELKAIFQAHNIQHYGWVPLKSPLSIAAYKDWLKQGFHGDMDYLERHLPIKEKPELLLPEARSVLVVGYDYLPHPLPHDKLKSLNIAQYARGEDYHFWLKDKLERLIVDLNKVYSDEFFLATTDSGPVLERDWAYQSGLGWFGKNTCIIHKKRGSFFLLGEVLSTILITQEIIPHPDLCGQCNRCIEACPTKAIVADRKIDARKCISYLTIESKKLPPANLREGIGDHFFGCDICQTVCPWNIKVFGDKARSLPEQSHSRAELIHDLDYILSSSAKTLEKELRHTPLSRARGFGLKRNALVVIGNLQVSELKIKVLQFKDDPRLGELARWTLDRL